MTRREWAWASYDWANSAFPTVVSTFVIAAYVTQALAPALDAGWQLASAEPSAKGRNGVAVLSRAPITAVRVLRAVSFAEAGLAL